MYTFKSLDHSVDVASAFHTAVNPSIGHLSKYLNHKETGCYGQVQHMLQQLLFVWCKEIDLLHWLVVVFWVHKFSTSKLPSWKTDKDMSHLRINTQSKIRLSYIKGIHLLQICWGSDQHRWSLTLQQSLHLLQPNHVQVQGNQMQISHTISLQLTWHITSE